MYTYNITRYPGHFFLKVHPSVALTRNMFKKYWSEPRKHDRKSHRAATANKLVPILATHFIELWGQECGL